MRAALALVAIGGLFTSGAALELFEEDGDVTVLADKKAVVSEVRMKITFRMKTLAFRHGSRLNDPLQQKDNIDF